MSGKALGDWGESVALRHLRSLGYELRERNWRTRSGELDLVMVSSGTLVFVEVKARSSRNFGTPEESITPSKRRRLQRAAWRYLDAHDLLDADWRIDVVAIDRGPDGGVGRLDHYINAVEAQADL